MLKGLLRGQALRPFYEADGGSSGSGSQAADPAADLTPANDAGTPPPAQDQGADPPAQAADEPAEDDDTEPELTAEEWQSEATRARKQAAKYRTQLREAQAELAQLKAQADRSPAAADPAQAAEARAAAAERRATISEAASEIGVQSGMLKAIAELHAAETAEQISAALTKIQTFQAPASVGAHRPPAEMTQAPTLAQQIADAEKAGDVKLSMRLKAQQLQQIGAAQQPGR